ncbi:CARHSP1 [Bugula neritina]|uniref:CARHSP1 n=1 Tax=Bugula neritina TaxID=10212 RepID=A0A7J7KJN2_BUGNE|nr:CARHSP1 [Bugula neritina]
MGDEAQKPDGTFRIPSPYTNRRQRTISVTELAAQSPRLNGTIKEFCREKGHGFIIPSEGGVDLFVHISDVEGEFIPIKGDEVTFQKILIPPKNESYQAVHVKITHLKEGEIHHRWDGSTVQ